MLLSQVRNISGCGRCESGSTGGRHPLCHSSTSGSGTRSSSSSKISVKMAKAENGGQRFRP